MSDEPEVKDLEISDEVDLLHRKAPNALLKESRNRGDLYLCIRREQIAEVAQLLKDDLQYDYFSECLGVDYSRWAHERDFSERFEVVYNLASLARNTRVFLKIGVDDGQTVPTLKNVFLGAEYPERETWDMFGIIFAGNEQTQRFLLPDDWIGHPLRKEFPLGGEDVLFDQEQRGPAVEDMPQPHAGESFSGKTGTEEISGR